MLLYGQIFGYGYWVASGVIEEKSSRVVEILLSTARAGDLLAGKIIGIGLLGFAQLTVTAIVVLGLALVTGVIDLPAGTLTAVLGVLFWFLIGYSLYSCVFAVSGALVSRMEELQNTTAP
jgi:ABC-2 type transport system permease protein